MHWMRSWQYWGLSFAMHATIVFTTCLHFAYGPERTIRFHWYDDAPDALTQHYPDRGRLHGDDAAISDELFDFWKLSSASGDIAYYLLQVDSLDASVAPYKYRIVPTLAVRAISRATGLVPLKAFILFNIGLVLVTALLFQAYLIRYFRFSALLAALGGVLFVTMVANTETVAFPMLEPSSLFFSLLIHAAVVANAPLGFAVSSLGGVATKEVLVVASLLWWANRFQTADRVRLVKDLLIGSVPLLGYAAIRVAFGSSPVEVNYGFDLLHGQFPSYGERLLSPSGLALIAVRVLLAFSFMWLGLINLPQNPFLRKSALTIPFVILAAVLFSSRITRVLGVLFPIVLPLFLLSLAKYMDPARAEAAK